MESEKINNKDFHLNILILCPLSYVGSMAFVMESIYSFAERGHFVDVLVSDDCDPPFDITGKNLRTIYYRDKTVFRGINYIELFKEAWLISKNVNYDLIIGISQIGLIIAAILNRNYKIPYISYNDELWFGNERHTFFGNILGYTLKIIERFANKRVIFTVTQDYERGKILSKVNKINLNSIRHLPNARAGIAEISSSTFLHKLLGLNINTKIILWMGAVSPGDGALELAGATEDWPENIILVFHFRSKKYSPYMQQILEFNGKGKTIISTNPLPFNDVDSIVKSASIGLGLYAEKGLNTEYMGFSSGKINSFLRFGIPVIVKNFKGLNWVLDSGVGISLDNSLGVLNAIKEILRDYVTFQTNSINFYNSILSFDKNFRKISDEIELKLLK